MLKDVLQELLYFILVTNSILKIQILTILIVPQSLTLLLPLLSHNSEARRRRSRHLYLLLSGLQLNVALEGHV